MRTTALAITIGITLAAAGCGSPQPDKEYSGELDATLVQALQADSIDAAIVRQRTIYPHHFRTGTAELNELGRRDATVLGRHFRDVGGRINVRRGDAPPALYAARLGAVLDAIAADGVAPGRITFGDDLPGGDGLASDQVLIVMERQSEPASGQGMGAGSLDTFLER